MNREQIAEFLRGNKSVTCVDKKTYRVDLKSPVILKLKKEKLHIGGGREIDFRDVKSYIGGLTGMKAQAQKFDRNELRRNTTVLAKLYKDRVVKGSKKDSSFLIDEKNPSKVSLSPSGEVRISWADGLDNVYDFDDCIKHLTEFGAGFMAKKDLSGQATQAEQDNGESVTDPSKLGPNYPQPTNVEIKPQGEAKPTRRGKKKRKSTSNPPDPDSPAKAKPERRAKLGMGGSPLSDDEKSKAKKEIDGLKQGASIRLLIEKFDSDNDTIIELLGVDDKAVQRTRRAILREKRKEQ